MKEELMSYLMRMPFYCADFISRIRTYVTAVLCKRSLGSKDGVGGEDGSEGGHEAPERSRTCLSKQEL